MLNKFDTSHGRNALYFYIIACFLPGAIFAVTHTINALALIVGVFLFNQLYAALVKAYFRRGVFLIVAGIMLIPFVVIW